MATLPDLRTVEIDLAAWGVATPGDDPFAGSVTGHIVLVETDGSTTRPRWVSDYLLLQGQLVDHSDSGDPLTFDVLPSDLEDMDGTYYRLEMSTAGTMRIVNFETPSGSGTYQLTPDTVIDPDVGPQTITTVYDAVADILRAGTNVTLTEDDTAFTIVIAATGGGNGGGGGVTIRYGAADPDDTLGGNGDWYLQTTTKDWWQKVSGAWVERSVDSTVATAVATTTLPTPVEDLVGRVFNDDGSLSLFAGFCTPATGWKLTGLPGRTVTTCPPIGPVSRGSRSGVCEIGRSVCRTRPIRTCTSPTVVSGGGGSPTTCKPGGSRSRLRTGGLGSSTTRPMLIRR